MNPTRNQIKKFSKILERRCLNKDCSFIDNVENFETLCPKCKSRMIVKIDFSNCIYDYDYYSNTRTRIDK
ncbi:hypothetical protein [Mycoplasma sp. P36-A1]|uniref:hypothetical protein n=1 Tax=Mycoplasma sp. P36-A1 TaxID=3252900 RepID=UPI003C2F91AD